jgi:hypothetical protein
MKLIRFGARGNEKPGVLINDRRLDLSSEFRDWDSAFLVRRTRVVGRSTPYAIARIVPGGATLDAVGRTGCSSRDNCVHRFKLSRPRARIGDGDPEGTDSVSQSHELSRWPER